MNRLQWFKMVPLDRKSLKVLSERLLGMPYSKSNRMGFSIDNVRPELVGGRFIERVEFTEVVIDPFGAEMSIQRVRFDTTEFTIHADLALIECVDAGRNLKNLLNEVAKMTNFEVAISKVKLPLKEFAAKLKSGTKSMAFTRAVADDIELGDGVLGQLQAAGAVDIRKPLQQFLAQRKYELTRIRIALEIGDERLTIEASKTGIVSSTGPLNTAFRQILRKHVATTAETVD